MLVAKPSCQVYLSGNDAQPLKPALAGPVRYISKHFNFTFKIPGDDISGFVSEQLRIMFAFFSKPALGPRIPLDRVFGIIRPDLWANPTLNQSCRYMIEKTRFDHPPAPAANPVARAVIPRGCFQIMPRSQIA